METVERTEIEHTGSNPSDISTDGTGVTVEAPGLQEQLAEAADTFDVTGFKCVKCGLAHMHDTTKHRLSDTFDVSDAESASMEYNPTCHCGLHEAARHGTDYGIDESKAARTSGNAPIPSDTEQEMNNEFGSV